MTTEKLDKIGMIAGGGQFPLLFAQAVKKAGRQVVAIAHQGESAPELAAVVDRLYWIRLGQLGKIIKYFKKEGVREAVLLGRITKTNIFRDIRPDLKGLTLWNKISSKQDDAILRAVVEELEKEDIRVVASTLYLQHLLFPKGVLSRRQPSASQVGDIEFGSRVARAVGNLDIGQCVVVRNKTVLAVEAIEGTDATISRGGLLGKEKTVVVKMKKPCQDFRFDLPAIGLTTIKNMVAGKAAVLAVEAGQALLFDQEAVIRAADEHGLVVVGIEVSEAGALSY